MKIIVGSSALNYHGYTFPKSDVDVWVDEDYVFPSGYDAKKIPSHILSLIEHTDGYATPDSIYTIKCSHLGWSNPMWAKHKNHTLLLKHKGCKLNKPLYDALVEKVEVNTVQM